MPIIPVIFRNFYDEPIFSNTFDFLTSSFFKSLFTGAPSIGPPRYPSYYGYRYRPKFSENILNNNENIYQVSLDVQQFEPNEIQVKTIIEKNEIIIEAEHKERGDEHGTIARNFIRRYLLPNTFDITRVTSALTPDGILIVTAPKIVPDRVIPFNR